MLFRKSLFVVPLVVFTDNSWTLPAVYDSLSTVQEVQVCQEDSPFFIPHQETTKENATAVCSQYGGDLAPISNLNFVDATALLFHCRGPMSQAWIRSWDVTDYGSNCLTLYTGSSIPGGGIDINCTGNDYIVPICVGKSGGSPPSPPPTIITNTGATLTGSGFSIATPPSTMSVSRPPFTSLGPIAEDTISFTSSL